VSSPCLSPGGPGGRLGGWVAATSVDDDGASLSDLPPPRGPRQDGGAAVGGAGTVDPHSLDLKERAEEGVYVEAVKFR
jgi:hypothetical protein